MDSGPAALRRVDSRVVHVSHVKSRDKGLGGPPGPLQIISHIAQQITPTSLQLRLQRTFTAPLPTTLVPTGTIPDEGPGRTVTEVPWLRTTTIQVGRNSNFIVDEDDDKLSDEQLEQIGGVEYRALRVLSYLVPLVGCDTFMDTRTVRKSPSSAHSISLARNCSRSFSLDRTWRPVMPRYSKHSLV